MAVSAADPMLTHFSFSQCQGSLVPYPSEIRPAQYPDSLVPVFINHVGRHGSRYPASSAHCITLDGALAKADSLGTITALGRKLRALNKEVIKESTKRWGELDSLGMAEQAGIAERMFLNFAEAFPKDAVVQASSSYSPRAMMSMFSFVHRLDQLNKRATYLTSTGTVNSPALRPFDVDEDYIDFLHKSKPWNKPYREYLRHSCPTTALQRVLGKNFPGTADELRELALVEYYVVAGLSAMGKASAMDVYFTVDEANALWSCFNLRQYLQHTASTVSSLPADIASTLLMDIISSTDAFVDGKNTATTAVLRFGHAETLMPLLSLMRLPACYYLTNYFDTVASHWQDFRVVPMAANIQLIVFRAPKSGKHYVRMDLNEVPVAPIPSQPEAIYLPWQQLRAHLLNLIPIYKQ